MTTLMIVHLTKKTIHKETKLKNDTTTVGGNASIDRPHGKDDGKFIIACNVEKGKT